jgi:hypothetical protein
MKKLFIVTLALLFTAGAAYAVNTDFSGKIETLGTYINNGSGLEEDAYSFMFYDMELDADLKILPSDKTLVFLNFEIHDEMFDNSPTDSNTPPTGNDDNIAFKRVYGKYTFDNGMSTTFGLMTGGAFGTAFADSADGAYRWRVDGKSSFGLWGVILEKKNEIGESGDATYDAEADDSDAYYAYWVGKFGDITPMVLLIYQNLGTLGPANLKNEGSDIDVTGFQVAVKGKAGAVGFEGEFDYLNFKANWDNPASDSWSIMGAYGNAWMGFGEANVGAYAAYGSWDDEGGAAGTGAGFNMGCDFYFGEGVGEWQAWGTGNNGAFAAVTLLGLYGDFAANDELSFNGNLSYWMSNEKDTMWEDGKGNEITVGATYKLSDNASYEAKVAYGQFDLDATDPEAYTRAFHRIKITW